MLADSCPWVLPAQRGLRRPAHAAGTFAQKTTVEPMARYRVTRAQADAWGALLVGLAVLAAWCFRVGWPALPAVIGSVGGYFEPVFGVVVVVSSALTGVAITTARALGPESNLWPLWAATALHPFRAALIVVGPMFLVPAAVHSGIVDREAEARCDAERIAIERQHEVEESARTRAEAAAAAAARAQALQVAAVAAAVESSRTPAQRASLALAALARSGDAARAEAHRQLDLIPLSQRCSPDVLPAFRAMHSVEMVNWQSERTALLAGRMALCCDGSPSPTCECSNIRSGCCSSHRGVCGCEDVEIPDQPPAVPSCRATVQNTSVHDSASSPQPSPVHDLDAPLPAVDTHHTCYRSDGTPQRVPVGMSCTALHYTDSPDGQLARWGRPDGG